MNVVDPRALVEVITQSLEDPTYVVRDSDTSFARFDTGRAFLRAVGKSVPEHTVRVSVSMVSDGEDQIDDDGAAEIFEVVVRRVTS